MAAKFLGLLPEVARRKLYEKKGFFSIYESAAKLAGVSQEQVRRALNLEKKFETTPILHQALVQGEISINKLARIASIATPENQEFVYTQAKFLPQKALEVFAKDMRGDVAPQQAEESQTGLFETQNGAKSVRTHTFELDENVKGQLETLHQKGININKLIQNALQQRETEIAAEKQALANAVEGEISFQQNKKRTKLYETLTFQIQYPNPKSQKASRHIPAETKRFLQKEHGTKCAIPVCQKTSEQLHHTDRHSLSKSHNPYFLAPLCKEHHTIAHSIDLKYQAHKIAKPI